MLCRAAGKLNMCIFLNVNFCVTQFQIIIVASAD